MHPRRLGLHEAGSTTEVPGAWGRVREGAGVWVTAGFGFISDFILSAWW